MDFLTYVEGLDISQWISTSDFGYPIMLSIHSIGLALVVGITWMLDLRVLGFAKRLPLSGFSRLLDYAWAGFVINASSGVLLFMSDAKLLAINWPFWLKMASVVTGATTFYLLSKELHLRSYRRQNGAPVISEPAVTSRARWLACISIGAWLIGIDSGRLIAYVIDSAVMGH
jgi:hypothetical protein